jgi:hypothetical protein
VHWLSRNVFAPVNVIYYGFLDTLSTMDRILTDEALGLYNFNPGSFKSMRLEKNYPSS